MKDRWLLLAVALPLFGLLTLVSRAEIARRSGPTWHVPIAGYDPRDLLHGHYLRYRFRLNWQGTGTCGTARQLDDGCCLCLTRANPQGIDPPVRQVACEEVSACDGWLRADAMQPPLRFFVPEDQAKRLEHALGDRAASLTLTSAFDGRPAIGDLYLDGLPWREALDNGS